MCIYEPFTFPFLIPGTFVRDSYYTNVDIYLDL